MVHPIPDGTATEKVRTLDSLPIIHEVAQGITHGMGIFRNMIGILDTLPIPLDSITHPIDTGILVGTHINNVIIALVLYGAACVKCLDSIVGCHEVLTRTCLIAQTPDDNAGMVHVTMHHLHVSSNMRSTPFHRMRQTCFTIIVLVTLNVRLVLKVKAILVSKIVEIRVITVVRETDMVDVATLHNHHLLCHLLVRNGMTCCGIRLMAVHTLELHGLAVDIEVATSKSELVITGFRVAYFDGTNAEVGGSAVKEVSLLVLQLSHKDIAIRRLSTPKERFPDVHKCLCRGNCGHIHRYDINRYLTHRIYRLIGIKANRIDGIGHLQALLCL